MRRSLARTQESHIDPGSSGIRWFKLTAALAEYGSAEANPCKWSPTTSRWTPDTAAAKIRVYSTAGGVTGEANAFVACYYAPWARRWEVISATEPGTSVVRFKLTENMYTGDAAEAVLRVFNGTTYVDGDAIMVLDWWGWTAGAPGGSRGMFQAVAGMEGWAVPREANGIEGNPLPEYDVVYMEVYAWTISFELQEDMGGTTPGQASANVIDSWEQGVAPPATVTILDDEGLFPRALVGAKGIAIRDEFVEFDDPGNPRYRVVSCQQMSKHAYALLAEDMTSTGDYDISDFIVTDFSPFNQTPAVAPTTANNLHGLQGETDDQVTLEWDEQLEKWVIQQVDYRQQTGESYRTAVGVIGTSLAGTDLSTTPGELTPGASTNTTGTVAMASSGSNAIFWPEVNGSSQLVWSRNLISDKTFYNATPFAYSSGDRVWVEEMPVQTGTGNARDVDTTAGKIWVVRRAWRNVPRVVLYSSGWDTDNKLQWAISDQYGGIASLADSNKNITLDCPVFNMPFLVEIHGTAWAEMNTSTTYTDFIMAMSGTWSSSTNSGHRWINAFRPNFGTDPFTINGPSPDVTGAASAGTAHTHSLSAHTHTVDASDVNLTIRPENKSLSFGGATAVCIPVNMTYRALATKNQVLTVTLTAQTGTVTTRHIGSVGAGTLSMVITPLFDA